MTGIASTFIDSVRQHRVPGWGSFKGFDGSFYVLRHEHPYVWTWQVHEPCSDMPGFMRVTPVNYK